MSKTKWSLRQLSKLWACVDDIAAQCEHPHLGRKMPSETWKALFVEAFVEETEWLPSLDGQRMVPMRWSVYDPRVIPNDLITLVLAYGDQRQVQWSDPEWVSQQAALARQEAA